MKRHPSIPLPSGRGSGEGPRWRTRAATRSSDPHPGPLPSRLRRIRAMGQSLTRKLLDAHLVSGKTVTAKRSAPRGPGPPHRHQRDDGVPAVRAMGFAARAPVARVAYIDHNVYQVDSAQLGRPSVLQTASSRYGAGSPSRQRHLHRCTSSPSASPASSCWAPTATPRSAARPACWPSARAGSTWRWRWAAGRITSSCRA